MVGVVKRAGAELKPGIEIDGAAVARALKEGTVKQKQIIIGSLGQWKLLE